MSTTLKTFLFLALSAIAIPAFAVPPKDIITVTAQTSTNGVVPTSPQPTPRTWFYVICLPTGGTLSDTLHIHFTDTNNNSTSGEIATVSFGAVGNPNLTSGITVPSSIVLDDTTNTTGDVNVPLSKSGLADGTYNANLQISVSPPGSFTITHDNIHIQVTVGGACNPSAEVTCFFTDSNFLTLTDCSGASVTTGFTDPLADWLFVNSSGQPCGPSGPCTITVPANDTLFVTWHLAWTGIGQNALGVNVGCANANAAISATGTVTGGLTGSCTADALGYRKK